MENDKDQAQRELVRAIIQRKLENYSPEQREADRRDELAAGFDSTDETQPQE
jgi:hypothetical protein